MPDASILAVKERISVACARYGIEVVGYLKLDGRTFIPQDEMGLLKGVKWSEGEVDTKSIKDPVEIMPGAKTMVILGKRLIDDSRDVSYRVSADYTASPEFMLLDIASRDVTGVLHDAGYGAMDYTSYYLKVWAVLAGLGWIGKSRMFVSDVHGPRLRLKGILTDAPLGEVKPVFDDSTCGECRACIEACPVGAIGEEEVDRKKCGSCKLNHRKIAENVYSYCTACTRSCPVGKI